MLVTALIVLNTILLGGLIVLLTTFKRSIPDIEQILVDVGADLSEKIPEVIGSVLGEPQVKRAMSVLGKQSGDVRAAKALRKRVADTVVSKNILLKKGLEYLDISSEEGLELMADQTLGPIIRNVMGSLQDGASGLLSGFGSGTRPNRNNSQRNDGRGVPLMS